MCAYGAPGAGLRRACNSSVAAMEAFSAEDKMASYNCVGETQLCLSISLLLFLKCICCNSGNDPWPNLCTIHTDLLVPNLFLLLALDERLLFSLVLQKELN